MQKFVNFFSEKLKLKWIVISVTFAIYFLFSFLMVTPGVGVESLRFINSIKDQISNVMPKGIYEIDGSDPSYEVVLDTVVKKAYSADAVSTLNSYENEEYAKTRKDYEKFSNDWYENRWGDYKTSHKDIDLYDLGMDLVEFDKAVSTEFLSFGYVNPGIFWMFHSNGLNEIFSTEIRDDLLRNQTVIDQELYNSKINSSSVGIDGTDIYDSLGTLVVNNKVWYLNKQIENIKYGLNIFGHSIFKNKSLNSSNMPKDKVTTDEIYTPHFTETLDNLRAGVIFFFVLLIVVIPGYVFFVTSTILINKKKGAKK
ncbi:hypothetical protein SCORR_v1c05500 [Spiroplasma corruscae]|uniref:Uncharacterized protein n=1 Tax=Spiroplasma corruscae TaxID=216934 RepID=A0A222EPB2_9MOLU|nr:hypothetical protein [Spiroplasma corruscae]ASP28322.1 hypothetical protein SCORR_v1c05500 [Spiroplasma corruscae]